MKIYLVFVSLIDPFPIDRIYFMIGCWKDIFNCFHLNEIAALQLYSFRSYNKFKKSILKTSSAKWK